MKSKLNLKKIQKDILKTFKWADMTAELKDNSLFCSADLTPKAYDDSIYMTSIFYDGGYGMISFHFDFITLTMPVLELINEFNKKVPYLKAYVNDKDCLVISHAVDCATEDTVTATINAALNDLVDGDTIKFLKPLTEITYSKN